MQIKVERFLKILKDFKTLVFLHDVGKRKRNWKTFFSANLLGIYGFALIDIADSRLFTTLYPLQYRKFILFSEFFLVPITTIKVMKYTKVPTIV